MAEEFEPYHVPQQSRRDKLRVLTPHENLVSLYHDPSINMDFPTSYMDPVEENINSIPFLYNTPQNLRLLDHQMVHNSNSSNNNNTNGHQGLSLSLSSLHHTTTTTTNDLSKSTSTCVPLGPFTGYSLILKRSRFLKPAQLLLEELCDVGIYAEKLSDDADSSLMDPLLEASHEINVDRQVFSNGDEHVRNKSRLISMLDEVYQKYKQYYQQLQMVVASFESIAGLGNAAPFANLALKAMSKHFKCLKDAITNQLQFTNKSHSQINCERVEVTGKEICCQRTASHNAGFADRNTHPVWRPQRGLPERAVTVLRAWLFDHFLHPYPTDTDKVMLAKQTGLSRNQVSNWFINARVRLWKPMVEEIHNLETREANKSLQMDEGQNRNINPIKHFTTSNAHRCDQTPSTSTPIIQDIPSKRTRSDLSNIPIGTTDPMNLSYSNLSTGAGGVSLTLGLHQNNTGIGLSEPFPINAARRLGIDANSDHRFMISSIEGQNGQYGRNMISGQFLHYFAG